jgi:hypothetical protein
MSVISAQPIVIPISTPLSVANSIVNLTLPAFANILPAATPKVYTINSNSLFPVVGNTYQVVFNLTISTAFATTPSSTSVMGVILQYENAAGSTKIVEATTYLLVPPAANFGFNASLVLTFTHSLSTNVLTVYIDNLTSATITGGSSAFIVNNISVVNLGTSGRTITATSFS